MHKNKYTIIFRRNPLASPHICGFGLRASWCHLRMFSVAREATYALRPWRLRRLQIGVQVTHLWLVRMCGNYVERHLDCILGGREARIQFSSRFNGRCCCVRSTSVTMQNNSICQHSSAFAASSGFHLHLKHSTIPYTINRLSTILVVPEEGPIEVPKQRQHHIADIKHTFEFLGSGRCFHSMLWRLHSDS
jgi:hypothetical protein